MSFLKEKRKNAGLSQKELAERLNVKQNTISSYEHGKRKPNIEMAKKLAQIFNCTVDELIA